MALNWDTIRPEHVQKACELVASGARRARAPAKGIFVIHGSERLPAKHVQRIAYLLANGMDLDTKLKFASGDGTLKLFRKLGFRAERGMAGSEMNGAE